MTADKKSITIDDIVSMANQLRDRKAEMDAFEGMLGEISAALAEIVEHMAKPKGHAEIAKAIGAMKLHVHIPDGAVHVHPTAPVQVLPAPVHVHESDWRSLHIKVGRPAADGTKTFTITKGA